MACSLCRERGVISSDHQDKRRCPYNTDAKKRKKIGVTRDGNPKYQRDGATSSVVEKVNAAGKITRSGVKTPEQDQASYRRKKLLAAAANSTLGNDPLETTVNRCQRGE